MPRVGPRHTIPRPGERPAPTRRWPVQVLVGAAIIGAVFLLMRWLSEPSEPASAVSNTETPDTAPKRQASETPRAPIDEKRSGDASPADPQFVAQLKRSAARRFLRNTPYTADVADLVADAQIADAAALLDARSAGGDRDSTVVLLQLQKLCESPDLGRLGPDGPETGAGSVEMELMRAAPVPAELRRRIEASTATDSEQRANIERSCKAAQFDERAIEQRLRSAAEAGHEASLWALGKYLDDPQQRGPHWLSAAMLGHPAAQADLAESLLQENLQGDRRNRGWMNFWLEAAAKHSPEMKEKLGECVLNGCNAQPPDSQAAVPLLREAAFLGEPAAFDALASISRSDPAALSDEELYGLQAFLQRLNDAGCYGAASYPLNALKSLRSLREIGSRLSPHALEDAEARVAAHWRDHGVAARRAQSCD
jgi:hypothetical protein